MQDLKILNTINEIIDIYNKNVDCIKEIIPEFIPEIEQIMTEFILKYVFLQNDTQKQDYLFAKMIKVLLKLISGETDAVYC